MNWGKIETPEILFSKHALLRMEQRGTDEEEVIETILTGEEISAKKGRLGFRKNYPFQSEWYYKYYQFKQVIPIVKKETGLLS